MTKFVKRSCGGAERAFIGSFDPAPGSPPTCVLMNALQRPTIAAHWGGNVSELDVATRQWGSQNGPKDAYLSTVSLDGISTVDFYTAAVHSDIPRIDV